MCHVNFDMQSNKVTPRQFLRYWWNTCLMSFMVDCFIIFQQKPFRIFPSDRHYHQHPHWKSTLFQGLVYLLHLAFGFLSKSYPLPSSTTYIILEEYPKCLSYVMYDITCVDNYILTFDIKQHGIVCLHKQKQTHQQGCLNPLQWCNTHWIYQGFFLICMMPNSKENRSRLPPKLK